MAAFNHYFTPNFHDVIFGSYEQTSYGRAKNFDWTLGGLGDASEYRIGNQFLWDPVKNLEFGLEFDYMKSTRRWRTTSARSPPPCRPASPRIRTPSRSASAPSATSDPTRRASVPVRRRRSQFLAVISWKARREPGPFSRFWSGRRDALARRPGSRSVGTRCQRGVGRPKLWARNWPPWFRPRRRSVRDPEGQVPLRREGGLAEAHRRQRTGLRPG